MSAALRLAATLAHQIDAVALTLRPPGGAPVVVSREPDNSPDLSACEFRQIVLAASMGARLAPGLSWLLRSTEMHMDGVGIRHVGGSVLEVDLETGRRWCWATLLAPEDLPVVLGDASIDLIEAGEVDSAILDSSAIAAHADPQLGTAAVFLQVSHETAPTDRIDAVARSLSHACAVGELLADNLPRPGAAPVVSTRDQRGEIGR